MPFQTFGQLSETRRNNFDFLRFFFASLVIFSHSCTMLAPVNVGSEPLARLTHEKINLGALAVACFFAMSGFLITQSWLRTANVADYFKKRALRIYPGWIVALLFSVFLAAPMLRQHHGLGLGSLATYRYTDQLLLHNVGSHDTAPWRMLPGIGLLNPSTWTIPFEILCYALAAVLGLIGLLRRRVWVLALAAALLLYVNRAAGPTTPDFHVFYLGDLSYLPLFALYFLSGTLFFLYRDRIPHSPWLLTAAIALCLLTLGNLPLTHLVFAVLPTAGFYALFYVAFLPLGNLYGWAKHGDLSYGVYLYAFPLQRLLISEQFRGYHLTPWALFLAAWVLSVGAAALSWRFVERPFLRLKPKSPGRPAEDAGVPAVPGRQEQIA